MASLRCGRPFIPVEPDGIASIDATQSNATWGLDRIDQRDLPLSSTFSYTSTSAGVTAYVIETGIRISHAEFDGRAAYLYDAVGNDNDANDCNGHGTHVAGTIGGLTYWVAKGVSLLAVRVLDCAGSGYWSDVIEGIDRVTAHHVGSAPAVANMSLGGGASSAVDTAVRNSIADGVTYALAAGNSNADACRYTPARVTEGLTVAASTSTDAKASYSNWGPCTDWYAPGSSITSAWSTNDSATNTISGTSMAAPHTAGAAALFLQSSPGATPADVQSALLVNVTPGVITGMNAKVRRSTPNRLLYTGP